jgi:RNA polymerase sigma factor (sigma-70 family)
VVIAVPRELRLVAPAAPRRRPTRHDAGLAELVLAARGGDGRAWALLVRRLDPMLRAVARRYGLGPAQIDDVVQETWMRLFEHLGRLRDPAAVGGWLVVTTRREALRQLQTRVREHLTGDRSLGDAAQPCEPECALEAAERRDALARAITGLPARHRRLMEVLLREPALDYHQVSARTGIPKGSIGPIRGRCLVRLAADAALQSLR